MNTAAVTGIGMTSQRTRVRMVERLREQGIRDSRVLHAMGLVPRHIFLEQALANRAYDDTALPLGFGQTISQPYVVARMIEILIAGRDLGKTLENRRRLRLPGRRPRRSFEAGFRGGTHCAVVGACARQLETGQAVTHQAQARRWQSRSARGCAV
jgi:hypothetical protein